MSDTTPIFFRLLAARERAFEMTGGRIPAAAEILSDWMASEDREELRLAVAALALAALMEPGLGELERLWKLTTGEALDTFVHRTVTTIYDTRTREGEAEFQAWTSAQAQR